MGYRTSAISPLHNLVTDQAATLFDDAFDDDGRITVDGRDVHPEYLRGVKELAGRLLGLDADEAHDLIVVAR